MIGVSLPTVTYEIEKCDQQWREALSADRYAVLRNAATEPPFTGSLLRGTADGTYTCAGCAQVLFSSGQEFESHCGGQSFDSCEPGTISERVDSSMFRRRTEIICSTCGGHLGHVFNDGLTASGLRYCVNSLAIKFDEANGPALD